MRLMYGSDIDAEQLVKFCGIVFHQPAVKVYDQAPVLDVYQLNCVNVAIEHFFIVVIFDLHYLITAAENKPASVQPVPCHVQRLLRCKVQAGSAYRFPLYRCSHLNILTLFFSCEYRQPHNIPILAIRIIHLLGIFDKS